MSCPRPEPRKDALTRPHPDRLDSSDPTSRPALDAHRVALDAGEPGYFDPGTGLFVMTAGYLLDRGFCCDRGCRHCPWVPELAE